MNVKFHLKESVVCSYKIVCFSLMHIYTHTLYKKKRFFNRLNTMTLMRQLGYKNISCTNFQLTKIVECCAKKLLIFSTLRELEACGLFHDFREHKHYKNFPAVTQGLQFLATKPYVSFLVSQVFRGMASDRSGCVLQQQLRVNKRCSISISTNKIFKVQPLLLSGDTHLTQCKMFSEAESYKR